MTRTSRVWPWLALLALLVAVRLPSLVQPAGGDQGIYAYTGQRILAGDVTYRDVWDQKPPGIGFVYALLWWIWPHESMVPAADLTVAVAIAALLVVIGRRRFSANIGFGAAAVFLLFGDPYLERMSGVYIRAQCEPFVALSVAAGLALLAAPARRRWHLLATGAALAAAFWLKYAAAYALPFAVAAWAWRPDTDRDSRSVVHDLWWIAASAGAVSAAVIGYFIARGAFTDLWLATINYNLLYSNETYQGPVSRLVYLVSFPIAHARVDMLWFLGAVGTLLLLREVRSNRSAAVALCWLLGAVLTIAINGARDLPNYFVQAFPGLALVAAAGFATLAGHRAWVRGGVTVLLLLGLWRVGADAPVYGLRLASFPGLVENVEYDLQYVRGRIDRDTYLSRFYGQKHNPLENERLVRYIRETTAAGDPVYVFGFSGGSVCWKSGRQSSSRFFWSRPVLVEFGAGRTGYGSAGVLTDLKHRPPAVVALQNEEWHSRDFFMKNEGFRAWLEEGYVLDRETPMFSVWRRRS